MIGMKLLRRLWEVGPFFQAHPRAEYSFSLQYLWADTWSSQEKLAREEVSCSCGSTVRVRSIAHVLSLELFGESLAISEMPFRPDLVWS